MAKSATLLKPHTNIHTHTERKTHTPENTRIYVASRSRSVPEQKCNAMDYPPLFACVCVCVCARNGRDVQLLRIGAETIIGGHNLSTRSWHTNARRGAMRQVNWNACQRGRACLRLCCVFLCIFCCCSPPLEHAEWWRWWWWCFFVRVALSPLTHRVHMHIHTHTLSTSEAGGIARHVARRTHTIQLRPGHSTLSHSLHVHKSAH